MNSTQKYVAHLKHIFSLKEQNQNCPATTFRPKTTNGGTLFGLIKIHLKSIIRCIIYMPIVVYQGWQYLCKTWNLKGSAKKKRALIMGNGPSQGYMQAKELDQFVESGGETYGVNYWQTNLELSAHVPTWIVFSDPYTLEEAVRSNASSLLEYLKNNQCIKLLIPTSQIKLIQGKGLRNEIHCFVDLELSIWKNINPLLPRGYTTLTLYKALAWTVYLGYESIGIIGMDNTFPKSVYNDENNKVNFLETHAGEDDLLVDMSSVYSTVASFYDSVFKIFYHLEYFPQKNIVNLDPYSLTDRFRKINKSDFLKIISNNEVK